MFEASGVDPPLRNVYLPGVQETTLFFSVVAPAESRRSAFLDDFLAVVKLVIVIVAES